MKSIQNQISWCIRAQWTMTSIMAALIGLFFVFGYMPANRRIKAVNAEISSTARQLEQNQSRAMNLPNLALDVDRLRFKLERFNKKLPQTAELGEFIREMTTSAQQLTIRKLVHQPGSIKRQDLFSEIPITMSFEGSFPDVFRFVHDMEGMPRLTRVKTLNVKTRDGKLGQVDVTLAMNIYFSEQ